MRIGTKISLGFSIVIVLTLILGLQTWRSIDEGEDMATFMALDRIPRLVAFSDTQNDLMQAVYYTRTYFLSRDEKNLPIALEHLDQLKKTIGKLQTLNKAHFYKLTDEFLSKFLADIKEYEELVAKGKVNLDNVQKTTTHLINSAEGMESKLLRMIQMMGDVQKEYIAAGNQADAAVYTDNMIKVADIYDRITSIMTELLVAERNQDIQAFTHIREMLPEIFKEFEAMQGNLRREAGRKLLKEIMDAYTILSRDADSLARLQEESISAAKARVALYTAMYAGAVDMQDKASDNTTELAKNASTTFQKATTTTFILTMAVVLLGIVVAFTITRLIVRPLAKTQHFAESVADGNLDDNLDVFGKDEIGRLADSLRTMVSALKSNIEAAHEKSAQAQKATEEAHMAMGKAEEAARRAEAAKREGMLAAAQQLEGMVEIISSASTELSAQIEQSDRGAAESSERLQEAATAMNEMNATVQEVARNAGSASEASHETRRKAESGEQVVRNVVQSIDEVQQVSMQVKGDMVQLNERAQDISRIMGVISDIADQTNLLALNAAIEAARAGEAGRGFAVVADEVRKLAEKTMTSTLDVSNAIRGIQESTEKSMKAFDLAVQKVAEATDLANESGAALEDIVATVDSTTDQVQAIATASEEQSAASDEINQTIAQVNEMSRMTAQAMQEATKAVSDLAVQAHNLTNLIEQMKKG